MFNDKKEREEWIKTLKAGDEVAIENSRFAYCKWIIYKIVKVTPTGRLNLENGTIVNNDGSIRGNDYYKIYKVTDVIRKHIWRCKAEMMVSKIDVKKLSDEEIMTMLDIYKKQKSN
ncbi:hypothetical protein [Bacillus sp. ISTL8]|uniref:hypothetical protein n=1 Tax=Bacillus sp. ISTL8 TaxID=2596896 RepID=UPI0014578755|nr:hypothetical protein [Bacillus sp. ISTL8]